MPAPATNEETVETEDWGDIPALPKKKGQAPRVACCCLGCGLPVLLAVIVMGWITTLAIQGRDLERQWTALGELLPYDAQPEGQSLFFGVQSDLLDFELYVFLEGDQISDPENADRAWVIMSLPEAAVVFLNHDEQGITPWTPPGEDEPRTTLEVQGRTLAVAWVEDESAPSFIEKTWGIPESSGASLVLELPQVEKEAGQMVDVILLVSGLDVKHLTADDLRSFLKPFHIGPSR